jgi:hypothetical protein
MFGLDGTQGLGAGAKRIIEQPQPGKKDLPIEAGMLTRMNEAFLEMSTRTTMVAR